MIDVLRKLVGALVLLGQAIVFGNRCVVARLLLFRDRRLGPRQPPQASGVAVGEIDRGLGPLPTLGADFLGCPLELLARETIEQGRVLQPTAVIAVEEVAQHDAARRLIGLDADELGALVGGPNRALRQLAADRIGPLVIGARERVPDFLLPRVIVGHAKGHELVERQFLGDIEIEQFGTRCGEFETLTHDLRADEKPRRDVVDAQALLMQVLEGPELIERMQRLAHRVLGEGVFLLDAIRLDDAGDRRVLREALLLDEKF